jgi:hypothetical protein
MAAQRIALFGIYPTFISFEAGVEALKTAEFQSADISVLFPENLKDVRYQEYAKTPTATGAKTGALLGGMFGWLVGLGLLTIPGVGPFVAAGPIAAALAGAGTGGAIGGITGSLAKMGVPEHHAQRYEAQLKPGAILVSVHSNDPHIIERAREILTATGAQDISSFNEVGPDISAMSRSAD